MTQPMINNKTKKSLTRIGVLVALIGTKLKLILPLLKAAKFLSFLSMIFYLFVYGLTFGWYFAFALLYLLICHEGGHLIAAKQKGLPTSPAFFIPFVGAVISMKEMPKDAVTESYVAFGGPLLGLISILPAIPLYHYTHNEFFGLVIALGCILNLFNLIPISPLDGGRILSVLPPIFWFIGIMLMFVFVFYQPNFIAFYIIFLGIMTFIKRIRESFQLKVIKAKIKLYEHTIKQFQFGIFNVFNHPPFVKRFFFPFFEDDKKLENELQKERIEINYFIRSVGIRVDETDIEWRDYIDEKIQEIRDRKIEPLMKEQETLETYYISSNRKKWQIFIAYIILVSSLALLGFWSYGLIEHVLYR
ncbi:site-2 protease family protein [Gottfriedia luciferensis]|uniref:site-2 protease family protein n=1 Tax=Gottfriedia luciferensis TaxID=178774 RepID=UPI000B4448EA|nr:site-2 protease family protein [Gottfriedia luciferensis]